MNLEPACFRPGRSFLWSIVGIGAALVVTARPTQAQGQVINACVNRVNGNVRFVSGPTDCRTSEDFRQYESEPGPQGPTGETGPTGATGPTGPTGPAGTTGQNIVTAYGSETLTLAAPSPPLPPSMGDFVTVPGLSIDVVIPDNSSSVFYISTDGGVRNTSAALGSYVTARIRLAVDGHPVSPAGIRLVNAINGAIVTSFTNWSFAVSLPTGLGTSLSPGPHTIDVRANAFDSSPSLTPMEISGPPTGFGSIKTGQLTVIAINK